jgi:hypothetical protein
MEFVNVARQAQRAVPWIAVVGLALAWPPIYVVFVHPRVSRGFDNGFVSTEELKTLLDARRYTIDVPMELDGHFLTFDAIVDGKITRGGGSSVTGGSKLVLLLRRDRESRKVEYCWFGNEQVSRGVLDDPISEAGVTTERDEGPIRPGDWLLRGGRTGVQMIPSNEPADMELRLAFRAP